MIRFLICTFAAALLLPLGSAAAQTNYEAIVTFTNTVVNPGTTNGNTITINGVVRTYTNNVSSSPSTLIQTTNSVGWSATNTQVQLATYAVPGTDHIKLTNTASLIIVSAMNTNLTVVLSAGVGTVVYRTNVWDRLYPLMGPNALMPTEAARTNNASLAAQLLDDDRSTNKIRETARSFDHFVGPTKVQGVSNKTFSASAWRAGEVTGVTNFTGTNFNLTTGSVYYVTIVGANLSGFINSLTNGTLFSNVFHYATITGRTELAQVILSRTNSSIAFTNSQGAGALGGTYFLVADTNGIPSLRRIDGTAMDIQDDYGFINTDHVLNLGTALRVFPKLDNSMASFLGITDNTWSTANYWVSSNQYFRLGIVVTNGGTFRGGVHPLSITNAFAAFIAVTATNLQWLGGTGTNVALVNWFSTNFTALGGNTFKLGADLAFEQHTIATVANGHNVIDVGTNVYVKLTGSASAAWTLGGITGGNRNGKILKLQNATGYDVTIQNESGTAPTGTDRIRTLAGAGGVTNVVVTGDGMMAFIYDPGLSRWVLESPSVDVIASGTNGVNTISTNGAPVSSAATSVNFIGAPTIEVRGTNVAGAVSVAFVDKARLFSITNDVVVTNTVVETSLVAGAVSGTQTIPANYLQPGMTIHVFAKGIQHNDGSPLVATVAVKLGSTLIATNVAAPVTSLANDYWVIDCIITVRTIGAAGTVHGEGLLFGPSGTGGSLTSNKPLKLGTAYTAATIDTTAALVLDVTLTAGEANAAMTTKDAYVLISSP